MNVLITGGAGFIGSHIADHIKYMGFNPIILDDLSGGFRANISKGIKFIKGSICDVRLVRRIFEKYNFIYVIRKNRR